MEEQAGGAEFSPTLDIKAKDWPDLPQGIWWKPNYPEEGEACPASAGRHGQSPQQHSVSISTQVL